MSSYIQRLDRAFAAAQAVVRPLAVVGYCMGGLFALALALRQQAQIAGLALLATLSDFHAERRAQARLLGNYLPAPTAAAMMPTS